MKDPVLQISGERMKVSENGAGTLYEKNIRLSFYIILFTKISSGVLISAAHTLKIISGKTKTKCEDKTIKLSQDIKSIFMTLGRK